MRKRRLAYLGALGLVIAAVLPASAMASGTQNVQAGFSAQTGATFPSTLPSPPSVALGSKDTKGGSLFTRLFLTGYGTTPSSAGVFDIHAPEELTFNTKGLT